MQTAVLFSTIFLSVLEVMNDYTVQSSSQKFVVMFADSIV